MDSYSYYAALVKPSWAPPSWLFAPVWGVLYVLIIVSFGVVFAKVARKELPRNVAMPFALNLLFNVLFTPIQFGLRSNILAAIDILLVLATLVLAILAIYPRVKWVALMNIPYLLWVMLATVLQITILILNL